MTKLQYKAMLEKINNLVESDYVFDLECNLIPNKNGNIKTFSQEDAQNMLRIILDVYKISHALHCKACR